MAKVKQSVSGIKSHQPVHKRTSQGGRRVKMQTMNKNKKASYKKYRGQGRWLYLKRNPLLLTVLLLRTM